jgi:hypothetical protein
MGYMFYLEQDFETKAPGDQDLMKKVTSPFTV